MVDHAPAFFFLAKPEMQTFICVRILLKRFPEAMIGHWTFRVFSLNEKIIKSTLPENLSCFKSQWKDYKKHPSGDVLCVNVLFRLECFQIMVEIAIWTYIFGPLFGYLTRPTVLLKSNSFKGSFNQVKLYNFQNFFQGKVAVKLFWVAESLTQK